MEFSFLDIINMLNTALPAGDNFAFRMARAATQPSDYLFERIMPSMNKNTWHTSGGTMTITPTILGDVSMDTPYPPMGVMEAATFFEKIGKFAGMMFFNEEQQKELLDIINGLRIESSMDRRDGFGDINTQFNMVRETGRADGNTINGARINAVLGISNSIQKSHWDTREYLRGEALTEGLINYTFNNIKMEIDYKIPAANVDTYSGNNRFDQSTSKFWDWVFKVFRTMVNPQFFMNSTSYYEIANNPANQIVNFELQGTVRSMIRYRDNVIQQKRDSREQIQVNIYDKAGSIMNAAAKTLVSKPFLKGKRIFAVGDLNTSEIELSLGGMTDPDDQLRLGYTHIGPTIEGGGRSGIYARIYSPEGKPMQVLAETATNMLPVILNPKKLMITKFD